MHHKIIIYQTLPRLQGNAAGDNTPGGTRAQNGSGRLGDFTPRALEAIRELGCNYVWYTGVIRHATRTDYSAHGIPNGNPHIIKGEAGSPYAVTDYYDIDPDLAIDPDHRMQEFEELVRRTHKAKLKVIIDFVPNHVARQYHSVAKPEGVEDFGASDNKGLFFDPQNNFYYCTWGDFAPSIDLGEGDGRYTESPAKATGNDCFEVNPGPNDWYETVKLNYGIDPWNGERRFDPRPDTWDKMLHILLYWAAKGVDGFRCDMAHMVPVEFWEWAITEVKRAYPDVIFIAELYDPALYRDYIFRGRFDYLYDKVGLYDTLRAVVEGKAPAAAITGCWQQLEGIQGRMLNFLENHDEQRIASDYFAGCGERAIPALLVSATMNVNPFLLYAGEELGEPGMDAEGFSGKDGRTSIFDYWSVDTLARRNDGGLWDEALLTDAERELLNRHRRILTLCNKERAISEGGFFDLMYVNQHSAGFDPQRHYAYLRHWGDDLVLVAVNFGEHAAVANIVIPSHAFEWFGFEAGRYSATELLTGTRSRVSIAPDQTLTLELPPLGGVMLRIRTKTPTSGKKRENIKKS
jgi:glycosidase